MPKPNLITEAEEEQEGQSGQPESLSILTEGTPPAAAAPAASEQDDTPEFEIVTGEEDGDGEQNDGDGEQTKPPGQRAQDDDQSQDGRDAYNELPNGQRRERRWSKNQRHRYQRDRDRQEIDTLRTQLDELRQQYGTVAPRIEELNEANVRSQRDQITNRVSDAERKYNDLNHLYYAAIKDGDFDKAAEIGQRRDDALVDRTRVNMAKEEFDRQVAARQAAPRQPAAEQRQQPQTQQQQRPVSPVVDRLAREFIREDAPWYGQAGAEDDTAVLNTLEQRVYQDGFDPETDDFWDEVHQRAARMLPNRFRAPVAKNGEQPPASRKVQPKPAPAASNVQPLRRGPPTGAPGNGRSSSRGPARVVLTPERREAALQAGLIDEEGRPVDKQKFWKVAQAWVAEDRASSAGR